MSRSPLNPDGTGSVAVPEITPEAAVEMIALGALLLDVREQDEWETLHAAAARHIPMGEVSAQAETLPTDRPIICVCHLGGRSAAVATALRDRGFDTRNLTGGMTAWLAAGLPAVDGQGRPVNP